MVAVGTHSRIVSAMPGASRVVVYHGLVVEIDNVKRAVRTHAAVNWPKPKVARADEFFLLSAGFFAGQVTGGGRGDEVHMNQVDGRIRTELRIVIFRRPCAAGVEAAAGHSREASDYV